MENNPYWVGKVHKAVKFGDPFDPHTVEGRKRAAIRAAHARRAKVEIAALRAEERSWSIWKVVFSLFQRVGNAH
jgi:hypothetical protein